MKRIPVTIIFTVLVLSVAIGQPGDKKNKHDSKTEQQKVQRESHAEEASRKSTGLILQKNEGERMVRRWGLPMTIKIDSLNGGSKQLLIGTEDLPPGKGIPVHKHSHCDEVVILLQGSGTAMLGDKQQQVTPGAILFIPENEWVGMENTGKDTARVVFIFSKLGFEKYLRATSVPEGQEVKPFSPKELAEVREKFKGVITFKEE